MVPAPPPPGSPTLPGPRWDGRGTSFALRSATAEAVELCLFDVAGTERRIGLTDRTGDVWHGYAPGVGPGQLYGFRVTGPYDPSAGLRHNPSKLLLDPYARAVHGELRLHSSVFGFRQGSDATADTQDSAAYVPRSVVVDEAFDWQGDRAPATPWRDTVVYEMHVKGFTAQHPGIPGRLRGTYAGLACPEAVGHLLGLGITAVELLPVQQFVSEPHLLRRGLTNYWGYGPVGYFAPHAAYSSAGTCGEQVAEFKTMVRTLHEAGLEVLIDVVYNHSGEGDESGPTIAHRGIDNAGYFRLDPADPARYDDVTGTGNTVDLTKPAALSMVMDSLRYWVSEMHVDGFRFDLASALTRGPEGVDLSGPFLQMVARDPVLSGVKLVAEPWDLGTGGYLVGRFPAPWAEWNDRFRDGVRDAWRGHGGVRDLAFRLSGSSDLFAAGGRTPTASVNFVTAHDGFSLHDLTAYERKRNEANGEDGRDGENHNRSWNCGVEGPTDDPDVDRLRRRQARNLLTTLMLSAGIPMLSMGDEVRRTQRGNNNAYCQDGPLSWQPWDLTGSAEDLRTFTAGLVHLRRAHPVLRQDRFFLGRPDAHGVVKDLAWFGTEGTELTPAQWLEASRRTIGMYLDGQAEDLVGSDGAPITDESFLLVLHLGPEPVEVTLPGPPWARTWTALLDTDREHPAAAGSPCGTTLSMTGLSAVLLRAVR